MDSDKLFPHQADLPPLPLPALSDTLERYVLSIKPLVHNEEEWKHAQAVVHDFGREGGEGETLHAMLEEKANNERNWCGQASHSDESERFHALPTPRAAPN